jgi:hypothetical protein
VVRPPGVRAITPESAIMMPESAITMPGIADHHPGTGDHDGLEWVITFDWNARSRWAGLRTRFRTEGSLVQIHSPRPKIHKVPPHQNLLWERRTADQCFGSLWTAAAISTTSNSKNPSVIAGDGRPRRLCWPYASSKTHQFLEQMVIWPLGSGPRVGEPQLSHSGCRLKTRPGWQGSVMADTVVRAWTWDVP